ncbi:cytochrome c/c1 heme lyase-domain-containing protein [Pilobolus umbonatus]|nr:cytochrome c/c1 heme lyase-domain-containing protein [Pilobolus umbonatus]
MPKKEATDIPASCPIPEKEATEIPASCPMSKKETAETLMPKKEVVDIPPSCPMHNADKGELNKLNMIPNLAQTKQPDQKIDLPTERVISSIPKASTADSKWEYPSPQQFYNALRRKGWETPEEEIETMVNIHNFLNEEAWNEVLKWENKFKWILIYQNWKVDPKNCHPKQESIHDYYEAPEEIPGVPIFHLDIRPALDDFESMKVRFMEAAKSKWAQFFS